MQRSGWIAALLVLIASTGLAAQSTSFHGTLHLRDGCPLRGQITETPDGFVLANLAGQILVPTASVERVVRHAVAAASQPTSGPADPEPATQPAVARERRILENFPRLSASDVKRLKLAELQLDPPERVQVRLLRTPEGSPVEILQARDESFTPPEDPVSQAAAVYEHSGDEFLDQISLRGETRAFRTFRRGVLPVVIRGCARAGCHGGPTAHTFRLPSGKSEADAYATFVILNEVEGTAGPLLHRERPADSVLLDYLLPPEEASSTHPEVPRGRVMPQFKDRADKEYELVLDWIRTLHRPRPDYGLEAELPAWLTLKSADAAKAVE